MGEWLRGGLVAARVAGNRAELWFPGALIAFAGAGWIVLLGTVAPSPDASGMAALGLQLAANPWWPWNAVVLGVALLSGLTTLLLVIAFGEVALLIGLSGVADDPPLSVPRAMAVVTVAVVPFGLAVALMGWLAAPAILDAVTRANAGTPFGLRILGATWPYLLGLAALATVIQAVAAVRLRRDAGHGAPATRRRWTSLIAQAAVTFAAFLVAQILTAAMLAALWQPLAPRLSGGGLSEPSTLVLLLGFVWIWLVLVILAGVVQVWTSAWWDAALTARQEAKR